MTTNKKVQIIRGSKSYAEDILRVAAYCRVSTDSEDQVNSFIAQMHYYYSFIKQAAINARLDFEKEAWDTLKIARKALPDLESRSLEALCGYYQIPREHAHRAMDDAGNAGTVPKTGRRIFGRSPGMVCRSASEGQNETRGSGDGGTEKISGGPDPVP